MRKILTCSFGNTISTTSHLDLAGLALRRRTGRGHHSIADFEKVAEQINGVISRHHSTYNYEIIAAVRTDILPYARRTPPEHRGGLTGNDFVLERRHVPQLILAPEIGHNTRAGWPLFHAFVQF